VPKLADDARERVVEENLRLAYYLARRAKRRVGELIELEDLEQEAALGLMVAAQNYDPKENPDVPFGAFAQLWVIRYLAELIQSTQRASLELCLTADVVDLSSGAPGSERLAIEVWETVAKLPRRERLMVVRRFGLDGAAPSKLYELGQHLGVSSTTAKRLLACALTQLRRDFMNEGFTDNSERHEVTNEPLIKMA
jgi:RNA polymerase sigma factor (sigma-70 family)